MVYPLVTTVRGAHASGTSTVTNISTPLTDLARHVRPRAGLCDRSGAQTNRPWVEIGPQSSMAGEVASLICELTGMERAAFCNTGSEAVMAAMRVARTVTARDKIVYFTGDYHGTFDEVLLRATPHGAAPSLPNHGGRPRQCSGLGVRRRLGIGIHPRTRQRDRRRDGRAHSKPPPDMQPRTFLQELRAITAQAGTALIFDEVVTGFRVALAEHRSTTEFAPIWPPMAR